jgi:hypothetical protein
MDNCCGQNKNNMVLPLEPCLVEPLYFETVNVPFLVVEYTILGPGDPSSTNIFVRTFVSPWVLP